MKRMIAVICAVLIGSAAHADASRYFEQWPAGADPKDIGRSVTERFLASPHMLWTQYGTLHYAEVATWYGALSYTRLVGERALNEQLVARFEPFFKGEASFIPPINHVDHTVFGALPLELYMQTAQAKYRMLGLAFADGQWDRPTPEGLTNQTRYWIDDMYMITLVQTQADVREVCVGTGTKNDLQYYLDRPRSVGDFHDQAPVLWAASALLR